MTKTVSKIALPRSHLTEAPNLSVTYGQGSASAKASKVTKLPSPHPESQANGQTELLASLQDDWVDFLPEAEFVGNNQTVLR